MENKELTIKDFEQAIELFKNALRNKSKIKDEKGNEVEMLISYTEGDAQVMLLNGKPGMVIGNVLSTFRRLSGHLKIDFLYKMSVIMNKMAEELDEEINGSAKEIDITELTKTGNA